MSHAYKTFDTRLKRIGRSRARLAQGYSSKVGKDGLIVFRPKRRAQGFPIKGLLMLAIGFFCFKGLIIAHLGELVYVDRVTALAQGSVVEQAGAYMMHIDPVSQAIAQKVRPFF